MPYKTKTRSSFRLFSAVFGASLLLASLPTGDRGDGIPRCRENDACELHSQGTGEPRHASLESTRVLAISKLLDWKEGGNSVEPDEWRNPRPTNPQKHVLNKMVGSQISNVIFSYFV